MWRISYDIWMPVILPGALASSAELYYFSSLGSRDLGVTTSAEMSGGGLANHQVTEFRDEPVRRFVNGILTKS